MMAIAKQLVPGIYALGQRLYHEGKTVRPLSIQESQSIADIAVVDFKSFEDEMATIRVEIERIVGLPFHMMAS